MEIKIDVKDLLWLLTLGPSLKEVGDQPRYLKLCALAYQAYETNDKPLVEPAPSSAYNFGSIGPEWRLVPATTKPAIVPQYYPNKVGAIKYLRNFTGMGLKEAKDAVEQAIVMPTSICQGASTGGFYSWSEAISKFAEMGYTVQRFDAINEKWSDPYTSKPMFSDTPVPGGVSLGQLLSEFTVDDATKTILKGSGWPKPEDPFTVQKHPFNIAVDKYVKDKKAEK